MRLFCNISLALILLGGVLLTSQKFINVENTPKNYFIAFSALAFVITALVISVARTFINRGNKSYNTRVSTTRSSPLKPNTSDNVKHGAYGLSEYLLSGEYIIPLSIVGLIVSVHGLVQYAGCISSRHPAFPITGAFENPAGFMAVHSMLFPFCLFAMFRSTKPMQRMWYGLVCLLIAVTVALSESRSGILSLLASGTVLSLLQTGLLSFLLKRKWLLVLLVFILLIAGVGLYVWKADSANGRLFVWMVTLSMIKAKPLFGWGIGGFEAHYMDYQAEYFKMYPNSEYAMLADNVIHPFNEFLLLTVNHGLVTLMLLLALFGFAAWYILKRMDKDKALPLSVMVGFIVIGMFSYPLHYAAVWFLLGLTVVIVANHSERLKLFICRLTVRVLLVLPLAAIGVQIAASLHNERLWGEIAERSLGGDTERMLKYYDKLQDKMRHKPLFFYNYAAELNYVERNVESNEVLSKCMERFKDYDVQMLYAYNLMDQELHPEAIEAFRHAAFMIPCRFQPLDEIMTIHLQENDTIHAMSVAREILDKPVKVESQTVSAIKAKAEQLLIDLKSD